MNHRSMRYYNIVMRETPMVQKHVFSFMKLFVFNHGLGIRSISFLRILETYE